MIREVEKKEDGKIGEIWCQVIYFTSIDSKKMTSYQDEVNRTGKWQINDLTQPYYFLETVEKSAKLEYNKTMSSKKKMKGGMNANKNGETGILKQNTSPQTGKIKPTMIPRGKR
jgi:hypothetical protein